MERGKHVKIIKTPVKLESNLVLGDKTVLFDIETTGLRANASILYIIGAAYLTDHGYEIIQWLNDDGDSESTIIQAFFEFLSSFNALVHYNGNGFDFPYLRQRCDLLDLDPNPLNQIKSIDLYKKIRPFKAYLDLENLKQKTLEAAAHTGRTEDTPAKELIKSYFLYLKLQDQKHENILLKHNHADLWGLLRLIGILSLDELWEVPRQLTIEKTDTQITLTRLLSSYFPLLLYQNKNGTTFQIKENKAILSIDFLTEELRFFYPNYKDYYYLPLEDTAMHKSVAAYVDSQYRKKATATTCYIRKQGRFLPQFDTIFKPVFKKEYKDKINYFEWDDSYLIKTQEWNQYYHSTLTHLFEKH